MTKIKTREGKIVDTNKKGLKDPYLVEWKERGYDGETFVRHATAFVPFVETARYIDHRVNVSQAKERPIIVVGVQNTVDELMFGVDKAGDLITLNFEDAVKNEHGETPDSIKPHVETYQKGKTLRDKIVKVSSYSSKKGKSKKPTRTKAHKRSKPT
ncbi:MAG: hypothetical protein GWN31_07530 [Candidatus Thorarchaeota archaeon]|nr:hypothetical protein [Candidatus Thorarchaeota archaeon]NIW13768.1 hypothetical protein [Candidatus Thorarchaeota archaeon]NIW51865.1 hypothetical protein [Candidatus Korarchaeota archaeon]